MLITILPDELKAIIFDAIAEGLKTLTPINSPPPSNKIYSLEESAEILNLSKYTVAKYARLGLLKRAMPHVKGLRFRYDELMRFSNEYRT